MKITGIASVLGLLAELQSNCGENRGRDGEYLIDQIEKIINAVGNIDAFCEDCEDCE